MLVGYNSYDWYQQMYQDISCQAVVGTVFVDIDTMKFNSEYLRIDVRILEKFTVVHVQSLNTTSSL